MSSDARLFATADWVCEKKENGRETRYERAHMPPRVKACRPCRPLRDGLIVPTPSSHTVLFGPAPVGDKYKHDHIAIKSKVECRKLNAGDPSVFGV